MMTKLMKILALTLCLTLAFSAAPAMNAALADTAGYSAQTAPTSYSADRLASYLEAGFVYVFAYYASSYSNSYFGARLAFRGAIEIVE